MSLPLNTLSINPDAATRDHIARLTSELSLCRQVLTGYEQWEADIILDVNEPCLDKMKTKHYDKLMKLQAMRNKAMKCSNP